MNSIASVLIPAASVRTYAGHRIGNRGAKYLSEVWAECKTLHTVDLGGESRYWIGGGHNTTYYV